MTARELLIAALHSIRGNLTRSALTILMVVIGVGSVITLVAVGNGASKQVNDQVASLGATAVEVFPSFSGAATSGFTTADAIALQKSPLAPDIALVAPVASAQFTVSAGSRTANLTAYGTTPAYFAVKNIRLVEGRLLTESDVTAARAVAVLDQTAADALFQGRSAVGQTLVTPSSSYQVVGVTATASAERRLGGGSGGAAVVPLARLQATTTGYRPVDSIVFSAQTPEVVASAQAQAAAVLTARASDPLNAAQPSFISSEQLRGALGGANQSLNNMLAGVAGISLVVGGIGVTNVMLITVRERTREIGIRKALGAQRASIAGQFLLEATFLSLIGGGLGVAVALLISLVPINGISPVVEASTVAVAAGLSVAVGVVFGTYPAMRAARLSPVEALRTGA